MMKWIGKQIQVDSKSNRNNMKKVLFFVLSVILSVSCTSDFDRDVADVLPSRYPDLTARFEKATRTYIGEGNNLRWHEDDRLTVFYGNTLNQQYRFNGQTGDNSGTFSHVPDGILGTGNVLDRIYAVYPYNEDIKVDDNTGDISLPLAAVQNYAANSFGRGANTMVAVTKNRSETFLSFKNIGGYLKLQIYGGEQGINVSKIVLSGNDGEKIAGNSTVAVSYGSEPTVTMSNDAVEEITLDCGEGVELSTDKENPTSFWIVLPAMTFSKGFTLTVTDTLGRICKKSTDKAVTIKRNIIQPMKAFEFVGEYVAPTPPDNQIWYTTSDGKVLNPYDYEYAKVTFGADVVSNVYADGKGVITFDGKVTAIADMAFTASYTDSERLTSINIPDSVTEIGQDAFDGCADLAEVVLHEGVTAINLFAFSGCVSLTEILLPDSMENINDQAFYGCTGIKTFRGKLASDDGRCLIKDGTLLIYALGSGAEYTIPEEVRVIGKRAFANSNTINKVIINDNVMLIEDEAFWGCDGITEISIPNSVTSLSYMSFAYCDKLASIYLPETIMSMEKNVFQNSRNLKAVYCKAILPPVPADGQSSWNIFSGTSNSLVIYVPSQSVSDYTRATGWSQYGTRIKEYEFSDGNDDPDIPNEIWYTSSDGNIVTPYKTDGFGANIISNTYIDGKGVISFDNDVTLIPRSAFSGCKTMTSVVLPNSVETIDYGAFNGLLNLVSVHIPESTTVIGERAFMKCSSLEEVIFSEGLRIIEKDVFYGCSGLRNVVLPESLLAIGSNAFYKCIALENLTLNQSLTTIADYAFANCTALKKVVIPDSVTKLGKDIFMGCSNLMDVTLGKGLTAITSSMFSGCAGLKELNMPDNITAIESGAFRGCTGLADFTIGNGVATIAASAFSGCTSLVNVTVPDSVNSIADFAFENCPNLRSFTGKGASADQRCLSVGNRVIAFAPADITEYTIPDNISIIGASVFINCTDLTEIEISNNVTTIEKTAFAFCSGLKRITISKNIMTIGLMAFRNCVGLEGVYFKSLIPPVADANVFYEKPSGCKIYVPAESVSRYRSAENLSAYAADIEGYNYVDDGSPDILPVPNNNQIFYVSSTASVITPYNASAFNNASITSNAYSQDRKFGIITFNKDITAIGSEAFKGCATLTAVTLPESIKTIGNHAFSGTGLTEFKLPSAAYHIGDYAFDGCTDLTDVDFGNVKIIGSYAFRDCGLTSVTLPEVAESFGVKPFQCSSLMEFNGPHLKGDKRSLQVGSTLVQLADGACKGLTTYKVSDDVVNICEGVFQNYTNLKTVTIPEGVKYIARNAFNGCSAIKKIILPSTLNMLGNYAFKNCQSLLSVYFNAMQPPLALYEPGETWEPCDRGTVVRVIVAGVDNYLYDGLWSDYTIEGFIEGDYSHDDPPVDDGDDDDDGGDDGEGDDDYGDLAQDGTVTILQEATKGNGIDIIIMGDAYSERQIVSGKYSSDMRKAIDMLFDEEPYKSFRNLFNIYQVTAVSENEGYGKGPTAFDGYFGAGTEVGGNHDKVAEYAEKAVSDYNRINEAMIIVLMNREYYAGTCYMFTPISSGDYGMGASISYFPLGTDDEVLGQLIRHEAGGHGFAKLADEYSYQSMGTIPSLEVQSCKQYRQDWGWWKNIDFTSNEANVYWSRFLNDSRYFYDGLGVYEGGFTYWKGVWRPTNNSIMNQNTGGYNAPSREAIYYRMHKLAYGRKWTYNYEEFVQYDKINRAATYNSKAYSPVELEPLHPPVVIDRALQNNKL